MRRILCSSFYSLVIIGCLASRSNADLTTGLVAYYSFDNILGTTVPDASGNGKHGTLKGSTEPTAGICGRALSFDGNGDYVESPDLALNGNLPRTITAWFKAYVHENQQPYWASIAEVGGDGSTRSAFMITVNNVDGECGGTSAKTIGGHYYYANTCSGVRLSTLGLNTWHHVALTHNGSAQELYIDGRLVGRSNYSLVTRSGTTQIGVRILTGSYFNGAIDEVRYYDRALLAAEVAELAAPCNNAPTANAGVDQSVHVGSQVSLDASASTDPDGDGLSYAWSAFDPANNPVTLSDPNAITPMFTVQSMGTYIAVLKVTDTKGAESEPDTVLVSTVNSAPIADAGEDVIATIGMPAVLNGSGSWDPDGDDVLYGLSYEWEFVTRPSGSSAALTQATSATPSFIPDVPGTYQVGLIVRDPWNSSAPDYVEISSTNVRPVADAGLNQTVQAGRTVQLDGSASSDANGDPLSYSWSVLSAPGSAVVLSDPTAVGPTFTPTLTGEYVVQLIVSDGICQSEPGTVTIGVISIENNVTTPLIAANNALNAANVRADFKNKNMQDVLTKKIGVVLAKIQNGNLVGARDQLRDDVLLKLNGCETAGQPDADDWVISCAVQTSVYAEIAKALWALDVLLGS